MSLDWTELNGRVEKTVPNTKKFKCLETSYNALRYIIGGGKIQRSVRRGPQASGEPVHPRESSGRSYQD